MRRTPMPRDTRGVNTAVGYVLAIGITTILVALLMISATGFVQSHQRSVISTEMDIVGQTIAAHAMDVDRTIQRSSSPTVERTVNLPESLGGAQYTIEVRPLANSETVYDNDPPNETLYTVRITTNSPVAESTVLLRSETNIRTAGGSDHVIVNGGDIQIRYENGNMVIDNA